MPKFGADRRRTDERADVFADEVSAALDRVARSTARDVSSAPTELDLVGVRAAWQRQVADVLLPLVEREWRRSADETWSSVADEMAREVRGATVLTAATAQTSAETRVNAGTVSVPKVTIEVARAYLETAQNRLTGIGDALWGKMREELVAGLVAGEGPAVIARRLRATADLTKPRAKVIARTEVIGATNRGAYSQVLATGLGGTKTWLATNDKRTRPSHAAASGATAEMTAMFDVGGHAMDGPHDPTAPPEETISCRCTLTYDLDMRTVESSGVAQVDLLRDQSFAVELSNIAFRAPVWKRGDGGLALVYERMGYNALPRVVSRAEFDAVSEADYLKVYRGLHDLQHGTEIETGLQFAEMYRSGAHYPGTGMYGNGTYTTTAYERAKEYAEIGSGTGGFLKMAVPRERLIDYKKIEAEWDAWVESGPTPEARRAFDDLGRFAAARGYAGIIKRKASGEQYVVVLDRSVVIVEEAES